MYRRGGKNTTHLYWNVLFLFVFVIYLNSNTSIIFIKKYKITSSKTKNLLPQIKTTHFYPKISMVFFFLINSLKHSKIFVIQILYRYHKSPLIHTNVYHLFFFCSNLKFFFLLITIFIPINKFKCPIGFQLLMVLYFIFKHYSMLPYLIL